jgi:putative transposase
MTIFGVRRHDAAFNDNLRSRDWPHAPIHRLGEHGAYIVTAGTYLNQPYLSTPERLDSTLERLFAYAAEFHWSLQAWAFMANHYHFLALSPDDPETLPLMLGKLHGAIARRFNAEDPSPGDRTQSGVMPPHSKSRHWNEAVIC